MSSEQQVEQPNGTKLYVGNIEYRTTREEIEDLFKDYNITNIEIPLTIHKKRGGKGTFSRAKGYVFVTFQGHDNELDDIINKFTDIEFKDRKIYVRYLNSKKETEAKSGETIKGETTETTTKPINSTITRPKKTFKAKKEKIPFEQGEKSIDTLYLKNLDFSSKPDDIKAFLEEQGETPVWVSVPLLKLPGFVLKKLIAENKKLDRRNKGFAFAKLELKEGETIEDKVAKFNGKSFKDRELLASVAVDVRQAKNEDGEQEEQIEETKETEE